MSFQIVRQIEGKDFEPALNMRTKRPLVYDDSRKAALIAARLTTVKGIKHQLRRAAVNDVWSAQEAQRFEEQFYKHVAWVTEDWWYAYQSPHHFTHVAPDDPSKVEFVRTPLEGAVGVRTVMKPGKYLTEFFGAVLTPEQIKTFAMWHAMKYENKELHWARTPEEIQKAYEPRVGGSCFSGSTKANLYGSGDFAVAYITNEAGELTGRAVCAPERKVYARVYGDDARLGGLLKALGFREVGYTRDQAFIGLRLVKKWYWRGFYTDFKCHVEPHPTDPDNYMITA